MVMDRCRTAADEKRFYAGVYSFYVVDSMP